MLCYSQSTGKLTDNSGLYLGQGYSGHDEGKNQPSYQQVPNVGPIPQGLWRIGQPYDSQHTGPFTLPLDPVAPDKCFGRSGFKIHGDSISSPGTASHGCIILPRHVRERVNAEPDRLIEVYP